MNEKLSRNDRNYLSKTQEESVAVPAVQPPTIPDNIHEGKPVNISYKVQ
jgi:hypothetical protein